MDPITKLLLAGAIAVMSYFMALYAIGLLMMTWHDEIVGHNEVLTEECPNYDHDRQFLFTVPVLVGFVVAGSFYLFWYQYLPR